jgi:AraC-like DNA-binding protein
VDYRELPLPERLDGLVKAVWTIEQRRPAGEHVRQDAMPDGCIDIIRRLNGTSEWRRPQPDLFVAGVIDTPAALTMSGDARLIGIRLWPWAWNMLGGKPAAEFVNDWIEPGPESLAALLMADPDRLIPALSEALAAEQAPVLAQPILRSRSVAEISIRSGWSYRQLQRWFATEIGVPPRRYVKLLRFQQAFADVPVSPMRLAEQAAAPSL